MKPESLLKMKKLQKEARQRILERGKIEFRVDPELLSAVLDLAKERKKPVGPMIRQWVSERLAKEKGTSSGDKLEDIERRLAALETRVLKPSSPARKRA